MRMGFEGPNEIVPTAAVGDSSNRAASTGFVAAAIAATTPATFSGQFQYVSATSVQFVPFNGASIRINGVIQQIPSAGVSITNSGLLTSTLYYVYVFMSSGTMTLEFSTTAYTTDTTAANAGTEIKTGDATRSLVGLVFTDGSSQFNDSSTKRNVRTWFNRHTAALQINIGNSTSITGSLAELTSAFRTEFVCWQNEVICGVASLVYFNNTSGAIITTSWWYDGAALGLTSVINGDGTSGVRACGNPTLCAPNTEGHHTLSMAASLNSGTASIYVSSNYSATIEV